MKPRILIAGATSAFPKPLLSVCEQRFEVLVAGSVEEALVLLDREPVDLILADVALPGGGGDALREAADSSDAEVVLCVASAPPAAALAQAIERAIERARRRRDSDARPVPYAEHVKNATAEAARRYLIALLERCQGNVSQAAREAGIERASFHRLLRRHGLNADAFRKAGADRRKEEK